MLNNSDIVSRIEKIRNNHKLTAASFATKIGVQRSAMSHILSGRNKPSLDFLIKIYDAFDDVNLEWLILGETSHLAEKIENKSNSIDNQLNEELNKIVPFSSISDKKTITPNLSQNIDAPKEIIYLYADGKFQRFTPKT